MEKVVQPTKEIEFVVFVTYLIEVSFVIRPVQSIRGSIRGVVGLYSSIEARLAKCKHSW